MYARLVGRLARKAIACAWEYKQPNIRVLSAYSTWKSVEQQVDKQTRVPYGLYVTVGVASVAGWHTWTSAVETTEGPLSTIANKSQYTNGKMYDSSSRAITSEYDIHEVLGKGQYGVCRRATKRHTGEEVAVKSIPKLKIRSSKEREEVDREIAIMRHLAGHPNIVKLFDVFEDKASIHLVMELCRGGELFDQIIKKGYYSEKQAAELVRTILVVIKHMHALGVVHRDLKPENFLFDTNTSDLSTMKATDFGLSSFFACTDSLSECVGSSYYIAPEVLDRKYGTEADVWSAGVILYILLCGSPPFYGSNDKEILQRIMKYKDGGLNFKFQPWPQISEGAKECVKLMLTKDALKRVSVEEVLDHPWMKENGIASEKPISNEVVVRLNTFVKMSKLQRMVTRMMAEMLSPAEVQGMRKLFENLDSDKDGVVTLSELRDGLKDMGVKHEVLEQEVSKIMETLDMDGSGNIDLEEFMSAAMSLSQLETEENLMRAFQQIDTDGNGLITRKELETALERFGLFEVGDIEEILCDVDKNNDGLIDYSEFVANLKSGKLKELSSFEQNEPKKLKTSSAIYTWHT